VFRETTGTLFEILFAESARSISVFFVPSNAPHVGLAYVIDDYHSA